MKSPPNAFLIWNPSAGRERTSQEERELCDRFRQLAGQSIGKLQEPDDVKKFVGAAVEEKIQTIIIAGGDGTVGQVIDELGENLSQIRFGIIPLGTGNDFARSLGIPLGLNEAINVMAQGKTKKVDTIRAESSKGESRYFANVCFSGFGQEAHQRIEKAFKENWGPFGHIQATLEAAPEVAPHLFEIGINNESSIKVEGSIIVIANATSMSAGLPIAPGAIVDDGKLDVIIFRPTTAPDMILMTPWVLTGTHLKSHQVFHRTANRATIKSIPQTRFCIDDNVFVGDEITFEVVPQVLEIYVP